MAHVRLTGGKNIPIQHWLPWDEIEKSAQEQLRNVASLPRVFHHVAVMPDCHKGEGATVGSVIAMEGAVSPAAVGVDIGCGMRAISLGIKSSQLPINLKPIRDAIEEAIPVGFTSHDKPVHGVEMWAEWAMWKDLHPKVQDLRTRAEKQLGTLGGGNHFIELCEDEGGRLWLLLHTGSRNIGKVLAEIHMDVARKLLHNEGLPDKALSTFLSDTFEMNAYRRDLWWAQSYALQNRRVIASSLIKVLLKWFSGILSPVEVVDCHHNYVAEEYHFDRHVLVTRKGAISAQRGQLGIIPGSMGSPSFIVEGLGNPRSFMSASHGAGRRMSRTQAKKQFELTDLIAQTDGVECRKDKEIIDEIPAAYKSIDLVMKRQEDLVRPIVKLRQLLCVKG